MRFDAPVPMTRGMSLILRNDDGEAVGVITSTFVSSRQGPFSSNLRPGRLSVTAECSTGKPA